MPDVEQGARRRRGNAWMLGLAAGALLACGSAVAGDGGGHDRAPSALWKLTVTVAGDAGGTVGGPGISCAPDCTESFPTGGEVQLLAQWPTGSSFTGWSGACTGTNNTCNVRMSPAKSVTATFAPGAPPDSPPPPTAETDPPSAAIDGPSGLLEVRSKKTDLEWDLSADEPTSSFRCRLDRKRTKKCGSSYQAKNLKLGRHRLAVRAVDSAGNRSEREKLKFRLVRSEDE